MKITEIDIREYGALRGFNLKAAPITVICTGDESDKTTVLDALLVALLGISTRPGEVEDVFEGDVTLERQSTGLEYTSASGDTLDRLSGLSSVYIENLLVVRESDLEALDENAAWWSDIKEHLSGFAGGLERVRGEVCRLVGLGPGGDWINLEGRRVKDEVERLEESRSRIVSLHDGVERQAQLRSRLKRISSERDTTQKDIELLKRAGRKELLQRAAVMRKKIAEGQARVEKLAAHTQQNLARWRETELEIDALREGIVELEGQKDDAVTRIKTMEEEAARHHHHAREWSRKETEILPEVEKGLQQIRVLYERERELLSHQNFLVTGAVLFAALTAVFVIFASLRHSIYLLPAIACIMSASVCAGLWLVRRGLSRKFALGKRALLSFFARTGELAADISDIESWVLGAHYSPQQARDAAEKLLAEADLERDYFQMATREAEKKRELQKSLRLELEALQNRSGCLTVEDFEERIIRRGHAIEEIKGLTRKICVILDGSSEKEWDEQLSRLGEYRDIQIPWDEEAQTRLEHALPELDKEEHALRSSLAAIQKELLEAGFSSSEDVYQVAADIGRKREVYERERAAARAALAAINELSQRPDALINSVLESGSQSATDSFKHVTGDRYSSIFWHDGMVHVKTRAGKTLSADSLSPGTRARLLFSLRMSLLQCLFSDEPLFLLLDDPFIFTHDSDRLRELLAMLVVFSHVGWQFIYLTLDTEVGQILQGFDSKNVTVKHL